MILCPNCQHKELPGALFCSECGTQLVSLDILHTKSIQRTPSDALESPTEIPDVTIKKSSRGNEPKVSLYIVDSGQVLHLVEKEELKLGRKVEGQPEFPDVDLSPFDAFTLGVSRMHAALRNVNGEIVVSDLGSSNGTRVNGKKIVPHVDYPLNQGDVITLGKLKIQILIKR